LFYSIFMLVVDKLWWLNLWNIQQKFLERKIPWFISNLISKRISIIFFTITANEWLLVRFKNYISTLWELLSYFSSSRCFRIFFSNVFLVLKEIKSRFVYSWTKWSKMAIGAIREKLFFQSFSNKTWKSSMLRINF
jgi:hypothetical protein